MAMVAPESRDMMMPEAADIVLTIQVSERDALVQAKLCYLLARSDFSPSPGQGAERHAGMSCDSYGLQPHRSITYLAMRADVLHNIVSDGCVSIVLAALMTHHTQPKNNQQLTRRVVSYFKA
jgi:hypothetical protein